MKSCVILVALLCGIVVTVKGQNTIRTQDIAFSRTIVREINLHHADNEKVFGTKALFSKILLEASANGSYKMYRGDSSEFVQSYNDFLKTLIWTNAEGEQEQYLPEQLYIVEITEEIIFDKHRSEFVLIPKYVTLFIPAEINHTGIQQPVATWKFMDCKKIFYSDSRAFSKKTELGKSPINFYESLLIRNYNSEIVKIGDREDPYFDQQYASQYEIFMGREAEKNKINVMVYETFHPK